MRISDRPVLRCSCRAIASVVFDDRGWCGSCAVILLGDAPVAALEALERGDVAAPANVGASAGSRAALELNLDRCPLCGERLFPAWDDEHPQRCGNCGAEIPAPKIRSVP